MTEEKTTNKLTLSIADAWALAEVLRHRAPCATDCEYCGEAIGDRPAGTGYKLAVKVQRALLELQEKSETSVPIEVSEHEAWMIYRYLPPTSYQGARDLLMRVFKVIIACDVTTEMPPWAQDLDLGE